jgi:hypothetical protein
MYKPANSPRGLALAAASSLESMGCRAGGH